jgi:hypothetical protein
MANRKPIPENLEKGARYLMAKLWPGVTFPSLEMYLADCEGAQGDMSYPHKGSPAVMRLDYKLVGRDLLDTYSTMAHEACHLRMYMLYDSKGKAIDAHGPEWRAEMDRIGLPVPKRTTREVVSPGGLFYVAYHEFIAGKLLPEIATAEISRAAASARGSTLAAPSSAAPSSSGSGQGWSFSGWRSGSPRTSTSSQGPKVFGPGASADKGKHLIFADCSGSMEDAQLFEIQRRAIAELISGIKNEHTLYGYAENIVEFPNPSSLTCDQGYFGENVHGLISGTSFLACFYMASTHPNPGHIHLFSDGFPENETIDHIISERDKTSCSISTYYLEGPGVRPHHNPEVARRLMASLARGQGSAHRVSSESELMDAVRAEIGVGPMPFTVQPRQPRDFAGDRQQALDHVKSIIKNQTHLVDLAGRTSDNTHRIGNLEEDVKFVKFTNVALRQVVENANEALDLIASQFEADERQRQITAEQNNGWIESANSQIGQLSADHFGNRLLSIAQGVASAPQRTALPSVKLMTLDARTVNQATALMAGRNSSSGPALPPPGGKNALALPPSQAPASGGALTVWGQDKSPTRR